MTRPRQKTYAHLASLGRMPSQYELVTTKLDYGASHPFEVELPIAAWYAKYRDESPLAACDLEAFRDPRETTYAKYTATQQTKEAHVDGILRSIDERGYDASLGDSWLATLDRVLPPLRFVFHGSQMLAAYLAQIVPSGRLRVAFAMQAADEVRRVQRFAYRTAQLRRARDGFGATARTRFETEPAWQPVRRIIEELFVVYDFTEAFVAFDLCVKPILDELYLVELGDIAREAGDPLLGEILFSLADDSAWHRGVAEALVALVLDSRPETRGSIRDAAARHLPNATRAILEHAEGLGPAFSERASRVVHRVAARLESMGVAP